VLAAVCGADTPGINKRHAHGAGLLVTKTSGALVVQAGVLGF